MTKIAQPTLEAAYRALDPQEVLAPGSAAYAARPVDPLATLATQLRLGNRRGFHLVSGHIGSGKTTELRRLAGLATDVRVFFIALDAISPAGKLSSAELAEALASEIPGPSRPPSHRLGSENQETHFLDGLRTTLHFFEIDHQPPPIALLDGLDKLSLSELEPTLARILTWDLPLTLVATVPLSYLFTPAFSRREGVFAGVHVVPALPVVKRDLQPNPEALAWFDNVLVGRGVHELFDRDAVERLAAMTAGIIRDFVRSCRESVLVALVQKRSRVDLEIAEIALSEFALRMTRPVSGDDLRVLNLVAETGRVVGHSTFLALIDGGQIVEYRDGSNWYAVHPLLRDIVARFAKELGS